MSEPRVGFALGRTHRVLRRSWEAQLAPTGLTAPQAAVLALLRRHPGGSQRDLARLLATDPMNVQRLVAHLAGLGLVDSRPDPADGRRHQLALSEAGARLAGQVEELAGQVEERIAALLGPQGRERLLELLLALETGLDPSRGGGLSRPNPAPVP